MYRFFKRLFNTGLALPRTLISFRLGFIGYLLVNPVGLH
jgi:hypothetical protein